MPGQRSPSSSDEPTSTSSAGNISRSRMSSSVSTAHMPRVIRRTIAPAKLLACQSVENRCTRQNASPAKRDISRSVSRMIPASATYRSTASTTPSSAIIAIARTAPCNASERTFACMATASTSLPEYTGINRSAAVATIMQRATHTTSHFSRRQWRKRNANTSRIAFLFRLLLIKDLPRKQGRRAQRPQTDQVEEESAVPKAAFRLR